MTIEEKAKRYDEVSQEVKDFFEGKQKMNSDATKTLEHLFPELKESEDERVRKELIDAVQGLWDDDALPMPLSVKRKNEWLAWLEKQGEQKPAWSEEDERNLKGVIDEIEANKNAAPDYDLATYDRFLSWLKSLRPQNIEKPQGKSAPEAINEPVDKIEPKFKLYDWVVTDKGDVVQIGAVNNGYYTLYNGMDFSMSFANTYWHKWTIDDARDGDVLAEDSCIFIIQKLGDNGTAAKTYCTLYDDGDFDNGSILYFDIDSTKPATKEQRNQLKKAMTEAGYTFDFEKKELKKTTTPKSEVADKIEPRFKVGDWVVANYSSKISQVVAVSEDGYGYQLNDGLCFGVSWCDIFHLWCIKDARDGDVLASDCSVFIFQDEYMAGKPRAYCGIVDGNFCQGSGGCWTNEQCHPATKEQWDTLRSKMKEAGYEWDSEKKELKEIAAPKSEAGDDEEDDKKADDKTENWQLTLARQRLGNEARTWKTPKVRKYE